MALRPCYLSHILLEEQGDQQVIFVTEQGGKRRIPIVIGPLEATAIDRAVKGTRFPRPLTHDLLLNLIDRLGFRLAEVRSVELREVPIPKIGEDDVLLKVKICPTFGSISFTANDDVTFVFLFNVLASPFAIGGSFATTFFGCDCVTVTLVVLQATGVPESQT